MKKGKAAVDIIEFVTDPQLLGLSLSTAQETLLRAVYGLPLSGDQPELFRQCTGRKAYPARPFGEATVSCGTRSGKDSRIMIPVLLHESLFGGHEAHLAKGERGIIPLVAQDQRATRVAFGYAKEYLTGTPLLASMVEDVQTFEIKLTNRVSFLAFPSTLRSLRGWSIPVAGMDELAFFRLEGSADSDAEIQASIRRGMLGFPSSRLIKISTPYLKGGILFDDFTRYFAQDSPDVLVWRAPSVLMNPTLRPERLAREQRLDPERFRREYEAEFCEDLDAFLPPAWVDAAVIPGRHELPPREGVTYRAAVDPSGGGADTFSLAIAHVELDGDRQRVIQDVMKGWGRTRTQGIDLKAVVAEISETVKRYGLSSVRGDRYAGQWVRQAFEAQGIAYQEAEAKASAYLELEPLFAQGALEILDHPQLTRELKTLERRARPGGKTLVDHPHGGHDDYANALALAASDIRQGREPGDIGITLGRVNDPDWQGPALISTLETHTGVNIAEHAAAGCPRCLARVAEQRG